MNANQHLSDAQLDDALLGDLALPAATHLAMCVHCTGRLAEANAPLVAFRTVSTAWSERRSATLSLPDLLHADRKPLRQRALAGAMTLATCALALTMTNATRHASDQAAVSVTSSPYAAATDEQVSRDNQMLRAIDRELATSNETPAALGLQPVSVPARTLRSTSLQD